MGNLCLGLLRFLGVSSASSAVALVPENNVAAFVMDETALPYRSRTCMGACGVVYAKTAVPALASGQFWPSPLPGVCTSGAAPGRGGRVGMVLFGPISMSSAMVVRVILRALGLFSCRVNVKSGTNEYKFNVGTFTTPPPYGFLCRVYTREGKRLCKYLNRTSLRYRDHGGHRPPTCTHVGLRQNPVQVTSIMIWSRCPTKGVVSYLYFGVQ